MRQPLPSDVQAALDKRDKIEAIRLLRDHTGLGLAEAKEAVELGYFSSSGTAAAEFSAQDSLSLPPAALAALNRGNKVEAIKLVREANHIDLKDAKDFVDSVEAGRTHGYHASTSALRRSPPGAVPRTSPLLTWSIILVLAIAVAVWWHYRTA